MNKLIVVTSLVIAAAAHAAGPVILFEQKVSQFREAAASASSALPATEVDLGDSSGVSKLAEATVIVAIGQKALQLALDKAPNVPTVFCLVLGATRAQLSDTVTGVPFEPDPITSVARLREVAPAAKRFGMIYNAAASDWFVSEAVRAAKSAGLTLITRMATSPQEASDAAKVMLQQAEVLWLPPDPKLFPKDLVLFFLTASAERSIPVIGFLDSMAQAGALASVSTDYAEAGKQAGRLAAEIAGRPEGRRLPVPPPAWAAGRLILNLKTAETLHIKPTAAAQAQAAQILK